MINACLSFALGILLTGSLFYFTAPANAVQERPIYDVKVEAVTWGNKIDELEAQGYKADGIAATNGMVYVLMQKRVR